MSMNKEPLSVDRKEIYRYLGYRGHEADEATKQLVEVCVKELLHVAEPKYVKREYPVKVLNEGTLDLGCFQTNSKNQISFLQSGRFCKSLPKHNWYLLYFPYTHLYN